MTSEHSEYMQNILYVLSKKRDNVQMFGHLRNAFGMQS